MAQTEFCSTSNFHLLCILLSSISKENLVCLIKCWGWYLQNHVSKASCLFSLIVIGLPLYLSSKILFAVGRAAPNLMISGFVILLWPSDLGAANELLGANQLLSPQAHVTPVQFAALCLLGLRQAKQLTFFMHF